MKMLIRPQLLSASALLVTAGLCLAMSPGAAFGKNNVIKEGEVKGTEYLPTEAYPVTVEPYTVSEDGVIRLSQTGCQFVEPEGAFHNYFVAFVEECHRTNRAKKNERVPNIQTLHLEPGTYKFQVWNVNVPYSVGFDLYKVDEKGKQARKPFLSGEPVIAGYKKIFEVELEEGKYVYTGGSNPTYGYPLIVSKGTKTAGAAPASAEASN